MQLVPLSKSTFSNFELCAFAAHMFKNLGVDSESSEAAQIGTDVHTLIEELYRGNLLESAIDIFAPTDEVADLVKRAMTWPKPMDEDNNPAQFFVEQYVMIDRRGQITEYKTDGILHGYTDVLWRYSPSRGRVVDWKSGRWEKINKEESHLYALLCKAFFPGITEVDFELRFVRSGNTLKTLYRWNDDNTCHITYPDGRDEILWGEQDPILEFWLARIRRIEATPPIPTPGSHCTRWYGKPCQFLNKECPLNDISPKDNLIIPEAFRGPNYSQALASIIKDEEITPELAANGLYAVQRLEEYLKYAKERIMDWSKENTKTIKIGTSLYGWRNRVVYDVDKEFTIQTLIENEVPFNEWPINISKSSINKLSKRKYREVREILDTFAIYAADTKSQFKELKPSDDEHTNVDASSLIDIRS